jgi:N-acetylglucosaminyldiphosphoundecaprenol N-acetyl-beta-D-mannosaminyltransferase
MIAPLAGSRITLLDCPIDNLSLEDALGRIETFVRERTPHQHIAVNVHKMVLAQRDSRLREILKQCELACADGQPVLWLARLLNKPLKARITGIDLMERLLELAAQRGYRVYFLGARTDVLTKVVDECKQRYSGLRVAGWSDGYWEPEEESRVVEDVRREQPDILFVALGSPQKEFFIHAHRETLAVPFAMGVGGSFDVIAGKAKRAPLWMQRAGLEWVWRVLQEPGRMWKRYSHDGFVFAYLVLRALLRRQP